MGVQLAEVQGRGAVGAVWRGWGYLDILRAFWYVVSSTLVKKIFQIFDQKEDFLSITANRTEIRGTQRPANAKKRQTAHETAFERYQNRNPQHTAPPPPRSVRMVSHRSPFSRSVHINIILHYALTHLFIHCTAQVISSTNVKQTLSISRILE